MDVLRRTDHGKMHADFPMVGDDVARLQCGSRRAQTSFERTLGVWPARRLRPDVSSQTAASGQ